MKRAFAFLLVILLAMTCVFAQSIYESRGSGQRVLVFDAVPAVQETSVEEAPVVEAPVVETPVAEAPVVEAPVVEAPVIEAPVAEAPVAEAPVIEAPVVEAAAEPEVAPEAEEGPSSYILEASALSAFAAGSKADGETLLVSDYFTVIFSAKSKVDSSSKTWDDGYASSQRINLGGKATTKKNSIRFSTDGAATVGIWWVQGGDDNREMGLFDESGALVVSTSGTYKKNSAYYSELAIDAAGTYHLGGVSNNNYIFKVEVTPSAVSTHVLETSVLEAFDKGAKAVGDTTVIDDFFTLQWSDKSKVDSSSKTWEDGYSSSLRANFGGKATTDRNSIRFETGSAATVKVWWVQGGDDNREIGILDKDGSLIASTSGTYKKNSPYYSELAIAEAGTYYLGGVSNNNYIFKVEVTSGSAEKPARAAWASVPAPVIVSAEALGNDIVVVVDANVGYDGADRLTVTMTDVSGATESRNSTAEKGSHELTFTPASSGDYSFSAVVLREEEGEKAAQASVVASFTLPLVAPSIKGASNVGVGDVLVAWDAVAEAEKYVVSSGSTSVETTELEATLKGLEVGAEAVVTVTAVRGAESKVSDGFAVNVKAEAETAWAFSAFGSNVSLANDGYEGNANEGSVRVWSTGGKGKLVPGSTDGLAFYYTEIDPKTQNFRLTATANVNSWTYSNGQEGFGLMACDRVAANGDKNTFWNNSYMASVTKVEYTIDGVKNSMRLGVGSQEKIGVTLDNITEALTLADMNLFSSVMLPLDTSCLALGAGTYNIVGNYTSEPTGTVANITSFILTIEKNNTGYFVSYTDAEGNTTTQKYYDTEALNHLDDSVYVGFFASRNADVTFSDISFEVSDPATDASAEARPTEKVDLTAIVASGAFSNSEDYILHFYSNANGIIEIRGITGNQVESCAVMAEKKVLIPLKLTSGQNSFSIKMTPAEDFKLDEYTSLSSYEPVTVGFTVDYTVNTASVVYVAPGAAGVGTKASPASIYTAVNQAVPGQTIVMAPGVYDLDTRLIIERGMDGTADAMITLMTEGFEGPSSERAVLDFGGRAAGMTLAASHWHLLGFDVTNSQDGQKGLQVSGSHNVVEQVNTYRNGNTGLQLSRYKGSDLRSEWPHDNLILNCTSYFNADKGYEDADGFAAKLTIGEGNVFDGCIAHHNADDGWDLYAKLETGNIGKVIIRNSLAYKNGYLLDDAGNEINAGNGNGFKMGGESLSGYHTLINSIAFANKTKGIDSNSCPDIQVECSTSFDNESYNVAFYTNTAVNTDYSADGVLSYRKYVFNSENLNLKGTQEQRKVYGSKNYYWDGSASVNADGAKAADDWFVSLDSAAAINGGITRNADGTINMNGFLVLTDKAPEGVGARF